MPLPMKRTANRLGYGPFAPAGLPGPELLHVGSDSSHGSAIVTPSPRRTVRREMPMALTSLPHGRQELHADRRRNRREHARRFQASVPRVNPAHEHGVGILIADREMVRRRFDAEVPRFGSAGPLLLDV